MTGTGTQNDPYVPADWDELKTAAETADAYIQLPQNAEWDMNDQYPSDTPNIEISCTELDGNGATIKNLRQASGALFGIGRYSRAQPTIKNLTFKNMYVTDGSLFSCIGNYYALIRLKNVKLGAELCDATFCSCDGQYLIFEQCSVSLYLNNVQMNVYTAVQCTDTTIHLTGTITGNFGGYKLNASAIYGDIKTLNSGTTFYFSGEECVLDINLEDFGSVYYTGDKSTALVNISKVGEAQVSYSSKPVIQATSSQMLDASWLRAAGFPVV